MSRPSGRVIALAAALATAMGLVLASQNDAFGALRGTSFTPCLPGTHPAAVHYTLGANDDIHTVAVSGLSADGCDGSAVTVVMAGNTPGDPTAAPTETLATYDSRLDPCTQRTLARPLVVANGAITLTACAAGGPARDTDIHDVTRLTLRVDGRDLPTTVLDEGLTASGGPQRTSVLGHAVLPFTGTAAAAMFWVGLVILAGGTALLVAGRRRRRPPA